MASNKNQHFVPRCYLRAFSTNGAGLVINLFNLNRRRAIPNAPLKGQCSRSYFYGEDLHLEYALQWFEGAYATALTEIVQPGYQLSADHCQQLKDFWCLQHLRTEATSKRLVDAAEEMSNDVGLEGDTYRLTMRQAVEMSVGMVPTVGRQISDLKLCLIRNTTTLPFITSDDPAISANRWYQQDARARHAAPGLGSAGALLLLPLTPNILCVLYDGSVYSVRQEGGWATLESVSDVAAFNQHQYLGAFSNVYFQDWETATAVGGAFAGVANRRPAARYRFHHAVLDRIEDGAEVFRVVSTAEARVHERSMVHQEAVFPVPTLWPHLIRFRPDGHVWFNNRGTGYSRRATIPPGSNDYRKYPSRRSTR